METIIKNDVYNWQISPFKQEEGKDTYSADDLIDAYLKGKNDAADFDIQMRIEKLESNLERAKKLSVQLYEMIIKEGFNCIGIKLKIKDIYQFSSIFLVSEDDYIDDHFLIVYEESMKLKKKVNNEKTFDYTTIFAPMNSDIEVSNMLADGYIFTYDVH